MNQRHCCRQDLPKQTEDPQQKRFLEVINAYVGEAGALIPILQETQEIFGYLPKNLIGTIAEKMKIPVAEVYGVATFYSQFRFTPVGRNLIRVCMGTACHVRGGPKILKAIEQELQIRAGQTTGDGNISLETVACMGACGLAPVISINKQVYGNLTAEMIPGILEKYKPGGE